MKYTSPNALDGGLSYIKANANKVLAVTVAARSDITYATLTAAGNIVAEVSTVPADFVLSGTADASFATNGIFTRVLTLAAGKQDSAANNSADPTHYVLVNTGTSEVIHITDELGAVTPTVGQVVNFGSIVISATQPT